MSTLSKDLIDKISSQADTTIGITSSPSTTLEIVIDISEKSKAERVLGQMVYVVVEEDGRKVLVIGQIISIETQNRWHEDPAFKGVIKRHGRLPHLSGTADNRIASISVQACYDLGNSAPEGYILGTSPSTGEQVQRMNNEVMSTLMKKHEKDITYMGKVYGTSVNLPFWFKHFDLSTKGELGAGDAYHIGVFGKTGSGKTVTSAYILLGYAKNKNNMNILVLDPQGQFFNNSELLPNGNFAATLQKNGMKYYKYKILEDLYLPGTEYVTFASLLQKSGFIRATFNILSDREINASDAISVYLQNLNSKSKGSSGNLNKMWDEKESIKLMTNILKKFTETKEELVNKKTVTTYNQYINMIYSQEARKDQLIDTIQSILNDDQRIKDIYARYWAPVIKLFTEKRSDGSPKLTIKSIIALVASEKNKGNFVILDLSEKSGYLINENLQAMFINIIENQIKGIGETFYGQGKKVNCLVVMDEAHRFISKDSLDPQIAELSKEIIDSVRTTRKFGIGYMFITQTIESLDREIVQQIRIFSFGYGMTSGPELRKISELVNNDSAIRLYKSFIDPSSNGKFPFMFFGPVSPLSFTGSPLFIDIYNDSSNFK